MENSIAPILISVISAFGTIAAAIIYYFTLKEIKKQRLDKYAPSLFIDRATFFVQGVIRNEIEMPYKWKNGPVEFNKIYTEFEPYGITNRFYLNLYNIGLGIAKNIEVRFSYDDEEFIVRINELAKKIPEDRRIKIELTADRISLSAENKNLPFSNNNFPRSAYMASDINNIVPISISNNYTQIDLPLSFMELFNIYMNYIGYLLGKEAPEINPPILTIEISYQNIANDSLLQRFTISTDLNQPFGGGNYGGQFIIAEGES